MTDLVPGKSGFGFFNAPSEYLMGQFEQIFFAIIETLCRVPETIPNYLNYSCLVFKIIILLPCQDKYVVPYNNILLIKE